MWVGFYTSQYDARGFAGGRRFACDAHTEKLGVLGVDGWQCQFDVNTHNVAPFIIGEQVEKK